MMGRELAAFEQQSSAKAEDVNKPLALEARQLGKFASLQPLDLNVSQGEVVGLAGLLGSGRTETARLLFGIDRADSGSRISQRPRSHVGDEHAASPRALTGMRQG